MGWRCWSIFDQCDDLRSLLSGLGGVRTGLSTGGAHWVWSVCSESRRGRSSYGARRPVTAETSIPHRAVRKFPVRYSVVGMKRFGRAEVRCRGRRDCKSLPRRLRSRGSAQRGVPVRRHVADQYARDVSAGNGLTPDRDARSQCPKLRTRNRRCKIASTECRLGRPSRPSSTAHSATFRWLGPAPKTRFKDRRDGFRSRATRTN